MDVHCCRWFTRHQSKPIPSCVNSLRGISALSLIGDLSLKGGTICNHAAPGTKVRCTVLQAEYHSKELLPTLWSLLLFSQTRFSWQKYSVISCYHLRYKLYLPATQKALQHQLAIIGSDPAIPVQVKEGKFLFRDDLRTSHEERLVLKLCHRW